MKKLTFVKFSIDFSGIVRLKRKNYTLINIFDNFVIYGVQVYFLSVYTQFVYFFMGNGRIIAIDKELKRGNISLFRKVGTHEQKTG